MRKEEHVIEGIPVVVQWKQMKNIIMRYKNGQYYLSVPEYLRMADIEEWVRAHLGAIGKLSEGKESHAVYKQGGYVDIFGTRHPIIYRYAGLPRCQLRKEGLYVYKEPIQTYVELYLRKKLEKVLYAYLQKYQRLGFPKKPSGIKIRKMTSRYGSCRLPDGELHFSFYLVHLPEPCIESVVIHELCHLLEPAHNEHFYALVTSYMPTYREVEKQLKQGGLYA